MAEDVEIKIEEEEEPKGVIDPSTFDMSGLVKDWEEGGKQGPKPGSERWNDIYREAQDAKRVRQELATEKSARAKDRELVEEMRKWNKSIVDSIENVHGALTDTTDKDLEGLEAKLVELKGEKKSAREKADFDRETSVDDEIVDVKIAIKEHKEAAKAKATKKTATQPDPSTSTKLSPEEEAAYKTWARATEWFQHDPKMRKAALEMEPEVWQDPDFEYATVEEVLVEVGKRVEKEFDYKPKSNGGRNRGPDPVEGGGGRGRTTSVKLNATELAIAQGFGLSPEDFAKQKAITARVKSATGGSK